MDSEGHVCSACGQPVETVVKRHKTLGAWVPVWVAGPCRNQECAAYVEEGAEGGEEEHRKRSGRKSGTSGRPGRPGNGAKTAAEEVGQTSAKNV